VHAGALPPPGTDLRTAGDPWLRHGERTAGAVDGSVVRIDAADKDLVFRFDDGPHLGGQVVADDAEARDLRRAPFEAKPRRIDVKKFRGRHEPLPGLFDRLLIAGFKMHPVCHESSCTPSGARWSEGSRT